MLLEGFFVLLVDGVEGGFLKFFLYFLKGEDAS